MNWRCAVGALALVLGLAACGEEGGSNGDATPTCAAGDTLCGSSCVDTTSDTRHCGACGVSCGAGETCSDGACTTSCPGGQALCDGGCYDVRSTAAHCGGCGVACEPTEACSDGACVPACPEGQAACDGGCYDLDSSAQHCGACGTACGTGELCSDGACVANCPAGQAACDGACFILATSNDHCGACGTACAEGEICTDGDCRLACAAGTTECDGACVNTDADRANCGACGNACDAGELCVDGACEVRCNAGTTECDGACVNTDADRANCGACGTACDEGEVCSAGTCAPFCGTWAQDVCDGACTNVQVDPLNCGACGTTCDAGEVCSEGACVEACAPGSDVCAGGCTSFDHDPANCGGCDNACSGATNAVPVCGAGTCDRVCMPGYGDCDGDIASSSGNGCEAPFDIDPGNCGACGVTCPSLPHATAGCNSGVCGIGQCDLGWADCDGNPANGCEVNIASDDANCGQCGVSCGAGTECVDNACSVPGFADVCSSAGALVPGANTIHWEARGIEYLTRPPSCANSTSTPSSGDVVLSYTATVTGAVRIEVPKATQDLLYMVVSDQPCGDVTEYACRSDYSNAALDTSFPVTAGTTYYIYIVPGTGTSSNSYDIPSPLDVTVTEFAGPNGTGAGDACGNPIVLVDGANTLNWTAGANHYFRKSPPCGSANNAPFGPDLVFKYTSTFNGAVELLTTRGNTRSLYVAVSEGTCGATDTALACTSIPLSAAQGRTVFPVSVGTDYYVHVVAHATPHTTNPPGLENPLSITVNAIDCAALTPGIITIAPANGEVLTTPTPVYVADLSHEARRDAGTITITGNMGTSHTFTLPSPFVTFSTDGKKVTISPEGFLRSGEQATVTLSLTTADCGVPFAPIQWTVTAPTTPCTPGLNGMVGATITRVPLEAIGSMFTEYYVATDDDPNGYLYLGSDSQLIRKPKAGGMFENVAAAAGLGTTHLGYVMLIDGQNIYTVDSKTTAGGVQRLWRITSNGGATWELTDVATFGTSASDDPEDDFRGIAARDGRLHLITQETTASTNTEIWSVDPTGALPAAGRLDVSFGANAYTNCHGLAMDANSYFTVCRIGTSGTNYAALRIARTGGAVTQLGPITPASSTQNAISVIARDHDGDGNADYLYIQADRESADFVCSPYSAAPYTSPHFSFGTGTGSYGMGFDAAANALWAFDDDTLEFVKIQ